MAESYHTNLLNVAACYVERLQIQITKTTLKESLPENPYYPSNDTNDKRGIVAKHLLAINKKNDPLQTEQALDDWYLAPRKDYDAFATKYPLNGEVKQQGAEIEKMKA
ncbi:MAG TPA: hypothetical protein VIJ95_16265 [Hanamia sp.]